MLFQFIDLGDGTAVVITVHIGDGVFHVSVLDFPHGSFFQRDQLVGQGEHIVDHALLLVSDADFLQGRHSQVPVLPFVDFFPVVVIVLFAARGGEGAHFVGQVGGAVHEAVGVISQGEPLFVGYIELSADFAVGQQGIYHEKQCKDGDSVQNQGQCGLLHCSFHIRVPPESLICSVYTKFGNNSSHICKKM